MANTCFAEIKRYEYMQTLYSDYSKLCSEYFGWKNPPKNSFARWVTECLNYENIDPILPSTTEIITSNPIVNEICEDFPGKVYPLLPFVKNFKDLDIHINSYLKTLDIFLNKIERDSKSTKIGNELFRECEYYYNKINNMPSKNFINTKKDFEFFAKKVNTILVELCKPLAAKISDLLMQKSTEFALEIKNLKPKGMKVFKSINEQCDIDLTCDKFKITVDAKVYCKLSVQGKNTNIWRMLQRYETLVSIDPKSSSLQAAVPYKFMEYLRSTFGVNFECFASPVNKYFKNFCSAFKDTDEVFGSKGNFLKYYPASGSFEANPPFSEELMLKMVLHMKELLKSNKPFSFVIILPNWEDSEANIMIKNSEYLKGEVLAKAGEHYYREITQKKYFKAIHDTRVSILQNKAGSIKWPVTEENLQGLLDHFVE